MENAQNFGEQELLADGCFKCNLNLLILYYTRVITTFVTGARISHIVVGFQTECFPIVPDRGRNAGPHTAWMNPVESLQALVGMEENWNIILKNKHM